MISRNPSTAFRGPPPFDKGGKEGEGIRMLSGFVLLATMGVAIIGGAIFLESLKEDMGTEEKEKEKEEEEEV